MKAINPNRRRQPVMAAALVTVAFVAVGCSGEDLAESFIENQIENESGGEVDIDFNDGGINVETSDGSFQMSTDEEGNVSIETEDGSMEMSADEDGNVIIESEDGSAQMSSDEEGNIVIESDEGSMEMTTGSELPSGFPSSVPIIDGLTISFSQVLETEQGTNWTVNGSVPGTAEDVGVAYGAMFEAAGFSQTMMSQSPGLVLFTYENAELSVSAFVSDDTANPGVAMVNLTVGPPMSM